jgi:hypothetical protein
MTEKECPFKVDFFTDKDWQRITPGNQETYEPYYYNDTLGRKVYTESECNCCGSDLKEHVECDLRNKECVGQDICPVFISTLK